MSKYIPLSVPSFNANEKKYVLECVESTWVSTSGSMIETFEKSLAEKLNAEDVCALQSGTAALHLALLLSEVGMNDEVLVPTLTFIAGVNPIKYLHAEPIFMDCTDNLCLDLDKVEEFLENECQWKEDRLFNKKTKNQIKAIIATHIFGNMVDMPRLMAIAKKFKLKVIEDSTEALGTYTLDSGQYAGTFGDFGIYSFNGNKIITSGGGGALTAKKREDVQKARYLSNQAKDNAVYFIHNEIGYNYRMTNIQAALGLAQLEQLDDFINKKKQHYQQYIEKGLILLPFDKNIRANYWFYSLLTDNRDELLQYLEEKNIQTRPLWKLIHTLKPYENSLSYKIEQASVYEKKLLNIPCSVGLKEEDVERVVAEIQAFHN